MNNEKPAPNQIKPAFKFDVLHELPPDSTPQLYFPKESSGVGRDGIMIRFEGYDSEPWVGVFSFGEGPKDQSFVFVGPTENHLAVVARGAGYIVCVASQTAISVAASPVFAAFVAMTQELLLFHDFTKVVAYGAHGLAWKSERLSWDGIQDAELRGNTLAGKAWDAPNERWVEFSVDVDTGVKRGGAAPPC